MKYKKRSDGYRSGFEATVAANMTRGGAKFSYEATTFPIRVPARGHVCMECKGTRQIMRLTKYTPDFKIRSATGTVIETKGNLTARNRAAMIAFIQQYPGIRYRVLFQRDNYLTKGSKTRYTKWGRDHSIICAVGDTPPKDWLK